MATASSLVVKVSTATASPTSSVIASSRHSPRDSSFFKNVSIFIRCLAFYKDRGNSAIVYHNRLPKGSLPHRN